MSAKLMVCKPLDSLKRADEGIAGGLQGFDGAIAEARAELARIDRESQTISESERRLLDQLNAEQQRWTELNRLLEELERSARQAGGSGVCQPNNYHRLYVARAWHRYLASPSRIAPRFWPF
jgi:chromosome segregation ATPase